MAKEIEIPQDVESLVKLVKELLKKVEQLEAENADLKRQLGMNSQNSHKPPSSDTYKKPKKSKSQLPKELKSVGGQVGHIGKTLEQVSEPDYVKLHVPKRCSCCKRRFKAKEIKYIEKRQVFDLPPARLDVTEHRLGSVDCCGMTHKGSFPVTVKGRVQYGAGVKAYTTMLSVDYRMPLERITLLFADRYGYNINSGTILKNLKEAYELLDPTEQSIKMKLLEQYVLHFDETTLRCEKGKLWLHTASTSELTYLFLHKSRGMKALSSAASIIKDFTGAAVHDCLPAYFKFDNCRHLLCGAHLLRELRALIEADSKWAKSMFNFLIKRYHDYKEGNTLTEALKQKYLKRYQTILRQADKQEPLPSQGPKGRPKKSKGRCLYDRLKKHQDGVLAFAFEENIPFTNNQAERDIRPAKVKQKISGLFRTRKGADYYVRIQAIISTLRKQSLNVFNELLKTFDQSRVLTF